MYCICIQHSKYTLWVTQHDNSIVWTCFEVWIKNIFWSWPFPTLLKNVFCPEILDIEVRIIQQTRNNIPKQIENINVSRRKIHLVDILSRSDVLSRYVYCTLYSLFLLIKSRSGTFNIHDLNKRNAHQWLVRFRTEPIYHLSAKQLFPPLIRHLNGTIVNRSCHSQMEGQLKLILKKLPKTVLSFFLS